MTMRRMRCACCGEGAGRWEQWHNQDTGYGLCAKCGYEIPRRTYFGRPSEFSDPNEMNRCYGIEGVNRPAANPVNTVSDSTRQTDARVRNLPW